MIYEYCLFESDEIDPHPIYHELRQSRHPATIDVHETQPPLAAEKPAVALLRVNKQVSAEATETLYTKNTVRLSTTSYLTGWLYFDGEDRDNENLDENLEGVFTQFGMAKWLQEAELVQRFITSFDFRDVPPDELARIQEEEADFSWPTQIMPTVIHDERRAMLDVIFSVRLNMLTSLKQRPAVEINLAQSRCPNGCCRLIYPSEWSTSMSQLRKLTLTGIRNMHEDLSLVRGLERHGIEFNIEDKASAQGPWRSFLPSVTKTWREKAHTRLPSLTIRLLGFSDAEVRERFKKGSYGFMIKSIPPKDACGCESVCKA